MGEGGRERGGQRDEGGRAMSVNYTNCFKVNMCNACSDCNDNNVFNVQPNSILLSRLHCTHVVIINCLLM